MLLVIPLFLICMPQESELDRAIDVPPKYGRVMSDEQLNSIRIWKGKPSEYFEGELQLELCELMSAKEAKNSLLLRGIAYVSKALGSEVPPPADSVSTRTSQEIVSEFLSKNSVDLNKPGKHGMTLIYWAYLEGNLDVFKLLLEKGASPDVPLDAQLKFIVSLTRTQGLSVLMHALQNQGVRAGFYLAAVDYTKKPNQRDLGLKMTILHYCVYGGMSEEQLLLLKRIIAVGADLNATNVIGETACHIAVRHSPQALLLLLKAGADADIPLPNGDRLVEVVKRKAEDLEHPFRLDYAAVYDWMRAHKAGVKDVK